MLDWELMALIEEFNIGASPYHFNRGFGAIDYWIYAEKGTRRVEIKRQSGSAMGKRWQYTVWFLEPNNAGYEVYYDDDLQKALKEMRKWLLTQKQEQMSLI